LLSRSSYTFAIPNRDEVLLPLLHVSRELFWAAKRHGAFGGGYRPLLLAVLYLGHGCSYCCARRACADGYAEVFTGFTFRIHFLRGTQFAQGILVLSSVTRHDPNTDLQLIRSEFQQFIENEQNIIDLVKDVANVLADVAVNSHHAPALYSTFLRALITARTDSPQDSEEVSSGDQSDNMSHGDMANNMNNSALFGGNPAMGMNGVNGMSDYSFASEMGPVADISTFPPTMADMPSSDEHMGMLSMENILSNGFWDSVLVPGKRLLRTLLSTGLPDAF
jgi:hypothetical protein